MEYDRDTLEAIARNDREARIGMLIGEAIGDLANRLALLVMGARQPAAAGRHRPRAG